MKLCRECRAFIAWLRKAAVTDKDAARLLAKLDIDHEDEFCEANAHWDRPAYRDFKADQRAGRVPGGG